MSLQNDYKQTKLLESNFAKVITNDELWNQLKNRIITQEQKKNTNFNSTSLSRQFGLVLENERKYLLTEATNTQFDVAKVSKIIMPLVRRFWPLLIQNEIVSTQAINQPTGFIRKLVVHYQNTELPGIIPLSGQNIPQPTENMSTLNLISDSNTKQDFSITGLQTSIALGSVKIKLTNTAQGVDGQQDPIYVQTDDGLGRIVGTYGGQPIVGSVDYTNGIALAYFVGAAPTTSQTSGTWTLQIEYQKDWIGGSDGDFQNREVTFDITNEPVVVSERKLRQKWRPEFWEDVSAIDGIDAQVEMYDNIANIIQQEINAQILNELYTGYNKNNYVEWDKQQPAASFYGTRKDWYETFMIKINELAQKMQTRTNIAEPNILVMHPTALTILRSALAAYGATDIKPLSSDTISMGYRKFDINGGTYKAFTSNLVPSDEVMMVYKGSKIEESGYVYAPYIPLTAVPWTENTGQMGIVFHTRYATKLIRDDWFGKLKILNPTV